jgi:hypothetical protein
MTFKSCDFLPTTLHRVLRFAPIGWNEPTYRELCETNRRGTRMLDLTLP